MIGLEDSANITLNQEEFKIIISSTVPEGEGNNTTNVTHSHTWAL